MAQSKSGYNMGHRVRVNHDDGTLEATRKIRSSGDSMVMSIPIQLLEAAGIEEGDQVEIVAKVAGDEVCFHLADADEE